MTVFFALLREELLRLPAAGYGSATLGQEDDGLGAVAAGSSLVRPKGWPVRGPPWNPPLQHVGRVHLDASFYSSTLQSLLQQLGGDSLRLQQRVFGQ